jgi:hypothetical protein
VEVLVLVVGILQQLVQMEAQVVVHMGMDQIGRVLDLVLLVKDMLVLMVQIMVHLIKVAVAVVLVELVQHQIHLEQLSQTEVLECTHLSLEHQLHILVAVVDPLHTYLEKTLEMEELVVEEMEIEVFLLKVV